MTPVMSGGNEEQRNDNTNPTKPVKNIKGLLRFCMEATRSEDAPCTTREQLEPMSEERKKWLEEALTSMSVSPVERMTACVSLIEQAEVDTEKGTDEQIRAVTELQDWTEDLDIAGDFVKINGLRIVPTLLASEVSELRWRCLELLAILSQNNLQVQTAVLHLQLLPPMVLLLDTDPNPTVRVKALYAISCLVRNNQEAQRQFQSGDGLTALINSLCSNEGKLKIKATFLISSLCNSNPTVKGTLLEKGVVEELIWLLKKDDHSDVHEHFMSALVSLVNQNVRARQKCLHEGLDLKTFLCQRIHFLQGQEQYQEELNHAEKLLSLLNQEPRPPASSSHNMALMLA